MSIARTIAWTGGLLLAAWIVAPVDPSAYSGGRSRDETARRRRNSSALAMMLGEFRTSVSDILFIKTEDYLHGGIRYIHHHSDRAAPSIPAAAFDDLVLKPDTEGHDHDHDDHPHHHHDAHHHGMHTHDTDDARTWIPVPVRDFRGWIGNLHRAVKPWRDPALPHLHTDPRELLPWFRLMTLSDRHYIRGYLAGAFWLQREAHDQAMAFIEEGLRHNPDAFPLHVSRALLHIKQARRAGPLTERPPAPAVRKPLQAALEDLKRATALIARQRPSEKDAPGAWGRYEENDALAACTLEVSLTRLLENAQNAERLAQHYREWFPDAVALRPRPESPP